MKIDEIAGAINFWIAADGKEYRLNESHVAWAAQRAGIVLPANRDDPAYWPAQVSVYKFMFSRGWMRTAIDHAPHYMYVENMINSRHKQWVFKQSKRYHLLAQDTEAKTLCDFRAQEPKQESHEGRDILLNLTNISLPGYKRHVDYKGTELYTKTLPTGVYVDVFVGNEKAKWDCAIALRDQTGHRITFVVYPTRTALLAAVGEIETAASVPVTADHAGLELIMQHFSRKFLPAPTVNETKQLARRMIMAARGPVAYAARLLEALPDLRDWILDQPAFKFHPYGNVMLVLLADQPKAKFMGGPKLWPRSLGMIKPDGEQWAIVHGNYHHPKLPDELRAVRFATREAAAFELWKLAKDPEPVTETKQPVPSFDRDVLTAYIETGLCPICESSRWVSTNDLCACASCHSRWKEVYENQELIGIVEADSVNVRDFILANPGRLEYFMRAYHPDDAGYRLAYAYDFHTFAAALRAALHKNENFYVEIEAWDMPVEGQTNLQNLWIITSSGEVKEASPERRAEVAANKAEA